MMKYYNLNDQNEKVSFRDAVIQGIGKQRGLFFPEQIQALDSSFIDKLSQLDHAEIAFETIQQFVGNDLTTNQLASIITSVLDFEFPLIEVSHNIHALELFHGPTLAFKDVGARFMSQCLKHFVEKDQKVTVLVATSGDTGSAVANGFYNVDGIEVVLLFPKGKVSKIQELQLTTLGNNITALEVNGSFDDCQNMVKGAFMDTDIKDVRQLTSANSINVARWLPQMWYYYFGYHQLQNKKANVCVSVPSGNFGNICAGILAKKMGLPIKQFIASTNSNDTIPRFLNDGVYHVLPTVETISNAMDVSDPSNFIRILALYDNNMNALKNDLSSYSFTDIATKENLFTTYKETGYLMDTHGAVAHLGLQKYLHEHKNDIGIFLETAHPIKFNHVIEPIIKEAIETPKAIQDILSLDSKTTEINNYEELKCYLLNE